MPWTAKRAALELLHRLPHTADRDDAYRAYRERHGDALRQFATWNAIAVEHGSDYRQWPEELQDATGPAVAELLAREGFRVVSATVVPDVRSRIGEAIREAAAADRDAAASDEEAARNE